MCTSLISSPLGWKILHGNIKLDSFENGSELETTPTLRLSAATSMRLRTSHRCASCPAGSARLKPKRRPSRRSRNPVATPPIPNGSGSIAASITSGLQNQSKFELRVFAITGRHRTIPIYGPLITWESGRIWSWAERHYGNFNLQIALLPSPQECGEFQTEQ